MLETLKYSIAIRVDNIVPCKINKKENIGLFAIKNNDIHPYTKRT